MICKFEHDDTCCNIGSEQYSHKCKKPCDTIVALTNAELIRTMSNEALAVWMSECNAYGENADAGQWLPWLKQPAEVDTHGKEPKQCPFCDGKAEFVRVNEYDKIERGYFVCENNCVEQRHIQNKGDATEAWNIRVND